MSRRWRVLASQRVAISEWGRHSGAHPPPTPVHEPRGLTPLSAVTSFALPPRSPSSLRDRNGASFSGWHPGGTSHGYGYRESRQEADRIKKCPKCRHNGRGAGDRCPIEFSTPIPWLPYLCDIRASNAATAEAPWPSSRVATARVRGCASTAVPQRPVATRSHETCAPLINRSARAVRSGASSRRSASRKIARPTYAP